jgi:hypothetical protein
MRILFLLLLLLNLGYLMWQWPQQTNDKILPSGPIPVTPNGKTLTLLSEIHKPAAAAPTQRNQAPQEAPAAGNP